MNKFQEKYNYLTHISLNNNFFYREIPKAACSTVKRNLFLIEYNDNESLMPEDIHNRLTAPTQNLNSIRSEIDKYQRKYSPFTFSITRNPYTRILSCYLDKFVNNQWEKRNRCESIGFTPNDEISFENFLDAINEQYHSEMDIHWLPQSTILQRYLIKYDYLGKLENFDHDFKLILQRIKFNNEENTTFSNHRHHRTDSIRKLNEHYTNEILQKVNKIYELDFQQLDYKMYSSLNELIT